MRYLITGGCGFIGSNLVAEILRRGEAAAVFDSLYRVGSAQNLAWLKSQGDFQFFQSDIRDFSAVENAVKAVKPDIVFHLAGQVAMTTSIENPQLDFDINVVGGHNLLEAIRKHSPRAITIYSSTNKVYGKIESDSLVEDERRYRSVRYPNGYDESLPLDFQSPYGCSKGAIDQYMLDYQRVFGLRTIVFRHSSVFGSRQFSTFDQGWIGWFVQKAMEQKQGSQKPFSISGSGKQVRDVLFISDLVDCYFAAIEQISAVQGMAMNLGGGMSNSLSLLELFDLLENELGLKLRYEQGAWRQSDQKIFVADISRAAQLIGWKPQTDKVRGIQKMIQWTQQGRQEEQFL